MKELAHSQTKQSSILHLVVAVVFALALSLGAMLFINADIQQIFSYPSGLIAVNIVLIILVGIINWNSKKGNIQFFSYYLIGLLVVSGFTYSIYAIFVESAWYILAIIGHFLLWLFILDENELAPKTYLGLHFSTAVIISQMYWLLLKI